VVDEILGEGGSFEEAEGGAGVEFVIDDLIMFAICSPTVKAKTGSFGQLRGQSAMVRRAVQSFRSFADIV
jgi:hypothetical protein